MNRRRALRISGAASCLLFTLSIFYPFLQTKTITIDRPIRASFGPNTFWSFKATYIVAVPINYARVTEPWFQDYWSEFITYNPRNKPSELGAEIAAALILTLIAQAATLLSGALAILKVKSNLFLSAAVLSLFTTLCMWLFSRALAYQNPNGESTFQAGFWLTLPAAALFLGAYIIEKANSEPESAPE